MSIHATGTPGAGDADAATRARGDAIARPIASVMGLTTNVGQGRVRGVARERGAALGRHTGSGVMSTTVEAHGDAVARRGCGSSPLAVGIGAALTGTAGAAPRVRVCTFVRYGGDGGS